jgi:hypothetical protein
MLKPSFSSGIVNKYPVFTHTLEGFIGAAARLLIGQNSIQAASILANADGRIAPGEDNAWWLLLAIPTEVYCDLAGKEDLEEQINGGLRTAMLALAGPDYMTAKIVTLPDADPDWRDKINQHISGEGITNQGRVRNDNIATREHDGLLFRSMPEIHFYNALKSTGLPFAPLSVVLRGGMTYRRVEPDFVIYKDGLVMIVEIDGDLYHTETPVAAHARLKFITDEGAKLERITATECDTPQKAKEAVGRVLATIDKLRRAR